MTRTIFTAAIVLAGAGLLAGCRTYPDYANDFRFPILRGDVQRGQQAFVELGCNLCHTVDGIDLPDNSRLRPVTVNLGGDLVFAKTYGDLVTSIINPSHVLSERCWNSCRAKRAAPPPRRAGGGRSPHCIGAGRG